MDRIPTRYLVAPLFVLAATAVVGNAFAPALLASHPLGLLALNATTRHLVLTANSVDALPYFVVAIVRRTLEDPLLYLLGRRYGDDAVEWLGRHLGGTRALAWTQRNFRRFGWPLVALFPGGAVCVLAGASGMGFWAFAVLGLVGTVATIAAIRASGTALSGPVEVLVQAISENWVALTVISVVATAVWISRRRSAGRQAGDHEPPPG